jgi:hypothetical protein
MTEWDTKKKCLEGREGEQRLVRVRHNLPLRAAEQGQPAWQVALHHHLWKHHAQCWVASRHALLHAELQHGLPPAAYLTGSTARPQLEGAASSATFRWRLQTRLQAASNTHKGTGGTGGFLHLKTGYCHHTPEGDPYQTVGNATHTCQQWRASFSLLESQYQLLAALLHD